MTAPKRAFRLRRILLGVLICLTLLAIAVVTTPWWWASAVRSTLAGHGVTFRRFETIGYSRFALHDVRFQDPAASVTASVARVEADTPLLWLIHAAISEPGPVALDTWQVEIRASDKKQPTSPPSSIDGLPALRGVVDETLTTLKRWLPAARATNGTVFYRKQKLAIASIDWIAGEGQLIADGVAYDEHIARAELRWRNDTRSPSFSAATSDKQWSVDLTADNDTVTGRLHLWNQPVDLRAVFPASGWTPKEAALTAATLDIPGQVLGIGDLYPTINSEARILWQNSRFTVDLRADGQPSAENPIPPIHAEIGGQGDTETLRIERFDITLPGTSARLLAPIVFDREARIRSGTSQFSLDSDLEKLPGLENLRGKITGQILVESASGNIPRLTAKLAATNVTAPEFDLKSAVFEAEQIDSLLTVKSAHLSFTDGSEADVKGVWNWRERSLTGGELAADIKPAAFARWLPDYPTFERLKVSAQAAGPLPQLKHSGKMALTDLVAGTPHPLSGSAEWSGTGLAANTLTTEIKSGETTARLQGRVDRNEAFLETLTLSLPSAPALKLSQLARVHWTPSLNIEPLVLAGGDTHLSVTWSATPNKVARVELSSVRSEWLADFLPANWPAWKLETATFEGRWASGPLEGSARVLGQVEITEGKNARLELGALAKAGGVLIERLLVSDETGAVIEARGAIPLIITPASSPLWKLDPNGTWSLSADTSPSSPFWITQAAASGIKLRAPSLTARIEGSVKKPDSSIELKADEIAFDRIRLPTITQLDARLVLDGERIDLEKLTFLLAGQAVTASGRTHVKADQRPFIIRNPQQLWSGDAEAKLHLPRIEIASLTAFLPAAFTPAGTLEGDLVIRASGEIDGTLKVADAAIHPIIPFGSFNEITGEIAFSGRRADLKSLTALASGQAIKASGSLAFPHDAPLKVDLSLAGKNLPLARQTGLLIRGDIDLHVKTTDEGNTTLSGDVNLHDSLFLRDVRSLVPTRGGSPSSRPPYFSVSAPPFRDWRLAVTIGGNRFITLRTPIFDGVASGRFQLSGTLFEPVALGQAVFNEGTIKLPFAALRLTSGSVALTQADPYSPQLAINAAARTLGYDVRMDLSGSASDPSLTFSSSPSLSSEQVLLMVMAGETPRNDISYSTSERATRIGTYLGKSLLTDFFGDPTAAERLTISSGENVSDTGKETYSVEYKLNERWAVVGERDEFDDYNAGIKFRLFSSKKKPAADATKP